MRILSSARQVFREQLYDQVSLQTVAAHAGVSVQTVLRRFHSKEELFSAVAAQISLVVEGGRDRASVAAVSAAVDAAIADYEQIGDEWLHFMTQEYRTDPICEAVEAGRRYHHAWVERVFGPHLQVLPMHQRRLRLAVLTAALDIYTWKVLRRELGLTRDEVENAVQDLVQRLLPGRSGA